MIDLIGSILSAPDFRTLPCGGVREYNMNYVGISI